MHGDLAWGVDGSRGIAVHRPDPGLMIGYYNDRPASEAKFRGEWFLPAIWAPWTGMATSLIWGATTT